MTLSGDLLGVGNEEQPGGGTIPTRLYIATVGWKSAGVVHRSDLLMTRDTQVSIAGKPVNADFPLGVLNAITDRLTAGPGAAPVRASYVASSSAAYTQAEPHYQYPVLTSLDIGP